MMVRVISWNMFHGRDAPPDSALFTWRSRLTRRTERNATHAQVNRDLLDEFLEVLSRTPWDIALLQECPPRWHRALAARFGADTHAVPTARNRLSSLRSPLAKQNPDLIASSEGGSNLTLVRGESAPITLRRELALRPDAGPIGRLRGEPERRAMVFSQCASGLCVANIHATNDRPDLAVAEIARAAATAITWAKNRPLVFGGDFNLRSSRNPRTFEELTARYGFSMPANADSIDHVLARGLTHLKPESTWPRDRREVSESGGGRLCLSDHAPLEAHLVRE